MDLITILPVVTKDLPISPRFTPYDFLSRCASSALLQLVNQWLNFTYSRSHAFRYKKKKHKSYFGKNRTHDFRTSRCAGYLLPVDHSGDEYKIANICPDNGIGTRTAVFNSRSARQEYLKKMKR